MRRNRRLSVLFATASAVIALTTSSAFAQLEEDDEFAPVDEFEEVEQVEQELDQRMIEGPKTELGVGLRLRNVRIPNALLELFVEQAAGGGSNFGFGLEFVRHKANFEIAVGIEYESLAVGEGVWVDKGEMIPQDDADRVEFDGFGWVTVDAAFIWHTKVHEKVALRYGAGIGLGLIRGEVLRTDVVCTTSDPSSCNNQPGGMVREPEDAIPPVFPVINLLAGAQIRPVEKIAINIEAGIRTIPYVGTTIVYFF
jgi:hypothetical protein